MTGGVNEDGCSGGDTSYLVSFMYHDPSATADAIMPADTSDVADLYNGLKTWKKTGDTISFKQGFDHLVEVGSENTESDGQLTVGYCYGSSDAPVEMVISVEDQSGNPGNGACADF
jgi:hypothetical protein